MIDREKNNNIPKMNSLRAKKQPYRTEMIKSFNHLIENYAYQYPLLYNDIDNNNLTTFKIKMQSLIIDQEFRDILDKTHSIKEKKNHITKYLKEWESLSIEEQNNIINILDFPYTLNKKYGIYDTVLDFPMLLLLFFEYTGTMRTEFNRDYDRIMISKAFCRLQYKTQVMVNSASDEQRTRLMHSLEVQKIAKILSMQLGANWELAETIAIGHDVGHTPFGHAGEDALNNCLQIQFCGKFAHAVQSVKVLNNLESHPLLKKYGLRGICLSKHVLCGILQHDTDSFVDNIIGGGYKLQYDCSDIIGNNLIMPMGGIESQIVYWADKIAYCSHDWEEFVSCGFLDDMLTLTDNFIHRIHMACERITNDDLNESNHEIIIIKSIKLCIKALSETVSLDIINENELKWYLSFLLGLKTGNFPDFNSNEKGIKKYIQDLCKYLNKKKLLKSDLFYLDDINIRNYKLNIFSKYEYECFFDFFNIALAWIELTQKYPDETTRSYNITFTLYNYFKKTNGRIIKTCLENSLIEKTKNEIGDENNFNYKTEEELIYESTKRINEFFNQTDKEGLNPFELRKKRKKHFKDHMIVSPLNKLSEYINNKNIDYKTDLENFKIINDFIYTHYVKSTVVRNMEDKANLIINKLFHYYTVCPEMLPYEYRTRLSKEKEECYNIELWKNYKIWLSEFILKRLREDYGIDDSKIKKLCELPKYETDGSDYNKYLESWREINNACKNSYLITPEKLSTILNNIRIDGTDDHCLRKVLEKLEKRLNNNSIPRYTRNEIDELLYRFNELRFLFPLKEPSWDKFVLKAITSRIVADYIASLTDRMAERKYEEITSSKTTWTTNYSD